MTTYYRDTDALITSTGVRLTGRDFALDELRQVWHQRSRRSWLAVASRGALLAAILLPIVVGVLGIVVAFLIDASRSVTIALAGGGVLVGLAAAPLADLMLERVDRSYDRGSRRLEIWARTPAGDVLLLRTGDAARFNRIYRALQRALDPAPAGRP